MHILSAVVALAGEGKHGSLLLVGAVLGLVLVVPQLVPLKNLILKIIDGDGITLTPYCR